ncbi:MAG: PP2C family serine/threonine-protein phosphatase [Steroidobacteraceae bacterium]
MRIDYPALSHLGAPAHTPARVAAAVAAHAAMLVAVDGMGGHADGARAAEITTKVLVEAFWHTPQPLFDPIGFLLMTVGRAHDEVVRLGTALPLEHRPRATCAVCLVQGDSAYWVHVGDSRIYHLRGAAVAERTRDHSHVEFLLREGVITPEQVLNHPMRNFVESCVGGDPMLPEMAITGRRRLAPNDLLLVCTDGFWGNLSDDDIARSLPAGGTLRDDLARLAERAVLIGGAASDNTTAAALRWMGAR